MCLCVCPLPMRFSRPLIGPHITWPDPGLSLVNPPSLQYGGGGLPPNFSDRKFFLDKSRNLFKFVSVLLSASVKRVCVSRMRDLLQEIFTIYVKSGRIQNIQKCKHTIHWYLWVMGVAHLELLAEAEFALTGWGSLGGRVTGQSSSTFLQSQSHHNKQHLEDPS